MANLSFGIVKPPAAKKRVPVVDKNGKTTHVWKKDDEIKPTRSVPKLKPSNTGYTISDTRMVSIKNDDEYPVAIEGFSAMACPRCETFFSLDTEADAWQDNHNYTCENCGETNFIYDLIFSVREDSVKFLDDPEVTATTWFHTSVHENWYEHIFSGFEGDEIPAVHLGTEQAALDRVVALEYFNYDSAPMYLYEVKLKDGVDIAPVLSLDDNSLPEYVTDLTGYKDYSATGVSRYLNAYESPGSISLLANPECFDVVSRKLIPKNESMSSSISSIGFKL